MNFYIDHLEIKDNKSLLPMAIMSAIDGRLSRLEDYIARRDFTRCVEQDMTNGIIAEAFQMDEDALKRIRAQSVRNCLLYTSPDRLQQTEPTCCSGADRKNAWTPCWRIRTSAKGSPRSIHAWGHPQWLPGRKTQRCTGNARLLWPVFTGNQAACSFLCPMRKFGNSRTNFPIEWIHYSVYRFQQSWNHTPVSYTHLKQKPQFRYARKSLMTDSLQIFWQTK